MSMERLHYYADTLRIKGAAIMTAGALALGLAGCTSENEPQAASAPEQIVNTVEGDATAIGEYGTLPVRELAEDIESQPDAAERYETLSNYDPETGEEIIGDLPLERSAALLTITYDTKSRQLVYEDSTPGLNEAESKLLGTVAAEAPLLETAMRSGQVDSFRFRQFEPPYSSSSYAPSEVMASMPHDYSAGADKPRQSNLYYFLPATGTIDLPNMVQMNRHEVLHAASGHSLEMNLTPQQEARYKQACDVLRHDAIQTMRAMGSSSVLALDQLRRRAPAALRPAFQTVLAAIRNGTYDELPWFIEDNRAQIPECFVQAPMDAVYKQIESRGLAETYSQFMEQTKDDQVVSDLFITAQDSWSGNLETLTVYKIFNESRWLHATPESENNGHAHDGWHELDASSLNRLYGDPDAFARDVKYLRPEVRDAAIEIIDLGQEILEQKYGDNKDDREMMKQLHDKRAAFDKALGN